MRPIASQYPVPMGLLAILAMFGLLVVVICETENVAKSVEDSVQNWGWQHANWTMDDDQLGADDELREFESSKRWDWRVYERSWEVESRRGGGRSRNGRRSEEEWRRRGRRCEEDDDDEEDEEEEEEDDRRKIRSAESDRRKIRSATQAGDDDGGVKQNVDENGGKKEEEEGGEGIETRQKPGRVMTKVVGYAPTVKNLLSCSAAADGAILLNSKEKRRLRSRSSEEEGEGRCRRRGRAKKWKIKNKKCKFVFEDDGVSGAGWESVRTSAEGLVAGPGGEGV